MPCSPGMTACKSSCAHYRWVQDHRADRAAWATARDNAGLGYAEETADWEKLNPGPLLKDKMLHREKAPDMEMQPAPSYGTAAAERGLLATTMFSQNAVHILKQLDPREFQAYYLHEHVARVILHLESYGIRASAVNVEAHMRGEALPIPGMVRTRSGILPGQDPRIARTPEWDSSLPVGDVDRTQYGLQQWEYYASPVVMAPSFRDEIRTQYVTQQTEEIYEWAARTIRGTSGSTAGITHDQLMWVQRQVAERITKLPPMLTPLTAAPRTLTAQAHQAVAMLRA